jgi:hypothetical protein
MTYDLRFMIYDLKANEKDMATRAKPRPGSPQLARQTCRASRQTKPICSGSTGSGLSGRGTGAVSEDDRVKQSQFRRGKVWLSVAWSPVCGAPIMLNKANLPKTDRQALVTGAAGAAETGDNRAKQSQFLRRDTRGKWFVEKELW